MQDISNINSLTCIHLKTTCFRTRKLRPVYTNMKEEWNVMLAFSLLIFKQKNFKALSVSPNFIEFLLKDALIQKFAQQFKILDFCGNMGTHVL